MEIGSAAKTPFTPSPATRGSTSVSGTTMNAFRRSEKKTAKPKEHTANSIASFFGRKKGDNIIKNEKQIVNSDKKFIPAKKIELDMLDENEIKVYNSMKPNVPVLPDELAHGDMSVSDIMSSLTILEMAGAVESGGGGYYMRTSPDDIMQAQND